MIGGGDGETHVKVAPFRSSGKLWVSRRRWGRDGRGMKIERGGLSSWGVEVVVVRRVVAGVISGSLKRCVLRRP